MTSFLDWLQAWLKHPSLRIGAIASLVFLLIGFVSILWTPYPIETVSISNAMQDPSPAHWLGTDHLGRDMISLVMKGTLTSFVVAAIAVAIGALIGVPRRAKAGRVQSGIAVALARFSARPCTRCRGATPCTALKQREK